MAECTSLTALYVQVIWSRGLTAHASGRSVLPDRPTIRARPPSQSIMTSTALDVDGAVAAFGSFVLFFPQAAGVFRNRRNPQHLAGVSAATQVILFVASWLWIIYGFGTGAYWAAIANFANIPVSIFILTVLYRNRCRLAAAAVSTRPPPPRGGRLSLAARRRESMPESVRSPSRNGAAGGARLHRSRARVH